VEAGQAPWFEGHAAGGDGGGNGLGIGPRYCMSIETKVRRFPERTHHIWLEPEGLPEHTDLVYPSGISTGLPENVQLEFLRAIPGLEAVEIAASGYCVEYDYVAPQQLRSTLESTLLPGLYLAGQINGTTGYEEAGAQGIIAGCNAGLAAVGSDESLVLGRGEAYIGVLIDDLQRLGADEP
jgi:tRNA uridine 5-carboxymethylaminomethyl modification enzyme